MTRLRFILLVLFVLLVAFWAIGFGGSPFLLFMDVPSLIITPIVPYIMTSFIYPFRQQMEFNKEIFTKGSSPDKRVLEQAIAFLNLLKKLTILAAVFATFIGFIGIMGYLSDFTEPIKIGKNFGVMAIAPFYAVIFIFTVIEPLKGAAQKNLIG